MLVSVAFALHLSLYVAVKNYEIALRLHQQGAELLAKDCGLNLRTDDVMN